jgi:ankyrin repeat protein
MGVPGKNLVGWWLVSLLSAGSLGAASGDLRVLDAVRIGDKEAVRSLLEQRADVNVPEADGATALAWAVHRDDLETADLLIRAGADVNAANDYGVTPLSLACTNRNAAMVEKLLRAGADSKVAQVTGETPLMTCARTGNVEAVKSLLARGADMNATEAKGQTALMWAVAQKHADVVRVVIEKGADVNARSRVVELLAPMRSVTYTKDVHFPKATGGFTPLMFAARVGDVDSSRILLEAGAKVNDVPAADGIGDGSALVLATASGHERLAMFLLEKGADPNATDGYGLTPLHWAMMEGMTALSGGGGSPDGSGTDRFWFRHNMPELVKALLARGADPNARIQKDIPPYDNMLFGHTLGNNLPQIWLAGATPFVLAAASGDIGTMRVLVEGRADPKIVTEDRTTPLMVAAGVGLERGDRTEEQRKNLLEATKLAVALGADVNAANEDGRTALHGAAELGAMEVIEFLVAKGANLEAKDKYGQTALTIAMGDPGGLTYRQLPGDAYDYEFRRAREQKKVAELLLKLGAAPFTGKYRDRSGE